MMSPMQFEALYQADWQLLSELLEQLRGTKKKKRSENARDNVEAGEKMPQLYRRACEHLALARARAYPVHIVDRLEHLTSDAHQVIYQRREFGVQRLHALFAHDFPRMVRAHSLYVWIATIVFVVPTLALGLLVYVRPELILSVVDAHTAAGFENMYSDSAEAFGRTREAHNDWVMFGFYIRNNIGVAFQCFASGLFFGVGSLFFLAFNGVYGGAIGGYLVERGLGATFFAFVVTHSAFEITAIVLSGAAGLRIGHSLLAPGNHSRKQALVMATRESIVIIYGAVAMLIIAAVIEAFWSSAKWVPPVIKYSVAAVCWFAVLAYLALQGREKVRAS